MLVFSLVSNSLSLSLSFTIFFSYYNLASLIPTILIILPFSIFVYFIYTRVLKENNSFISQQFTNQSNYRSV